MLAFLCSLCVNAGSGLSDELAASVRGFVSGLCVCVCARARACVSLSVSEKPQSEAACASIGLLYHKKKSR